MKKLITLLLCLTPFYTSAQDMQVMMAKMQEMQECIEAIDQSKLKEYQGRAIQLQSDLKDWCDSGQRDKAQDEAIEFGMEVAQSQTMKDLAKCTEIMKNAMKDFPQNMQSMMPKIPYADVDPKEYENYHVCDGI